VVYYPSLVHFHVIWTFGHLNLTAVVCPECGFREREIDRHTIYSQLIGIDVVLKRNIEHNCQVPKLQEWEKF
jgi:C4-type Zn-finger protein